MGPPPEPARSSQPIDGAYRRSSAARAPSLGAAVYGRQLTETPACHPEIIHFVHWNGIAVREDDKSVRRRQQTRTIRPVGNRFAWSHGVAGVPVARQPIAGGLTQDGIDDLDCLFDGRRRRRRIEQLQMA